jgi:hypothetical protein
MPAALQALIDTLKAEVLVRREGTPTAIQLHSRAHPTKPSRSAARS